MAYYIKTDTNSYCEINGDHTPDPSMVEVDKDQFDNKVNEVLEYRNNMILQSQSDKQQALDSLVSSLVSSSGLTEDQVRVALS